MKRVVCLLALISSFSLFSQVSFENVAANLGVNAVTGNIILGSGVSFYDFDNDGWDDLSFGSKHGLDLMFFKNFNGQFIQISLGEGLSDTDHHAKMINWVDFDNDGDNDLFVTSTPTGIATTDFEFYRNRLFENTGNLNFIEITQSAGLPMTTLGTYGASWGDYNNDGFLDVFICNRDENNRNYLFKNNGDGTFSDVSEAAGISLINHLSFCSAWIDINNDGYQDLYISNDKIEQEILRNIMYKNNGDGTFSDISESSGTNVLIDAMTVTVGDYNNDGWFDIYVTNLGRSVLLKNNGNETFTDVATETNTEFDSSGWCANFFDANNDGFEDLYVSGSLIGFPQFLSGAFYLSNGNEVFSIPENSGFELEEASSYSNAVGDINNDGFPDLAETNVNDEPVFLWENKTEKNNNWIKINLEGVESNKDGVGSVIELSVNGNKQYRYTNLGESYLAQNSGTEFIGLGPETTIDYIKVTWLSGIVDVLTNVDSNQTLNIVEGASLSISESNSNELSVYPNPNNGMFRIKTQNCLNAVSVYTTQGARVYNAKVDDCIINNVNLSHMPQGVYFATFSSDRGQVSKKLIKQ